VENSWQAFQDKFVSVIILPMKPVNDLDRSTLMESLHYDPETGIFTHLKNNGKAKIGQPAGCLDSVGYRVIVVGGKPRKAHRLAWLYMTGEFPEDYIDHINHAKDDNRFVNLREATPAQNAEHKRTFSAHGIKGIHYVPKSSARNPWRAIIEYERKTVHLGMFKTAEEAGEAYKKAALKYHGEFSHF